MNLHKKEMVKSRIGFIAKLILLMIVCLACKKEPKVVAPPITGFIEFKIDGKKYRIDDYGISSAILTSNPQLPLYQFIGVYGAIPRAEMVSIHQISNAPIEKTTYLYKGVLFPNQAQFSYVLPGSRNVYVLDVVNGLGKIEFTKMGKKSGEVVEGNFDFTGINYTDDKINVISGGHVLTEGKFSIILD